MLADVSGAYSAISSAMSSVWLGPSDIPSSISLDELIGQQNVNGVALEFWRFDGLRIKMSINQLLRYSVDFLIDSKSNGYTLITIHELKPWIFFAFKNEISDEPMLQNNHIRSAVKSYIWRCPL